MKTVTQIPVYDAEGNEVKIKVQRPRIFAMASQGKIPNPLLGVATKLLAGKKSEISSLKELAQMIELYCRVCLVEPKYEEANLDDDQMLAVFQWATEDVSKLSAFRQEQENSEYTGDGEGVSDPAQPDTSD